MHKITQAAYQTLDEIWGSIHTESQEHAEPTYTASLWRMARNVCTGFALQHRSAQELPDADAFEWLACICDERQVMALHPSALECTDKLKLAVVQAIPRTH